MRRLRRPTYGYYPPAETVDREATSKTHPSIPTIWRCLHESLVFQLLSGRRGLDGQFQRHCCSWSGDFQIDTRLVHLEGLQMQEETQECLDGIAADLNMAMSGSLARRPAPWWPRGSN